VLGSPGHIKVPNFLMPPLMTNHGNFIGSLGAVTRWMGAKAEVPHPAQALARSRDPRADARRRRVIFI
jgi:hypothetical protein